MHADPKVDLVLESSVSPAMEEQLMDRSRINQVLVNLVDNAVKITEEGAIKVMVEPDGANILRVSAVDRCKGIDPPVREELLGKFVSKSDRAENTVSELYLSKGIVEAHGGTMHGEKNGSGKGATFSFTLPGN